MKKILLLLGSILLAFFARPQSISKTDAENLAVKFLSGRQELHKPGIKKYLQINGSHQIQENGNLTAYVFNFAGGGYTIVSASEYTFPILGYSLTGSFIEGNQPENLSTWLRYYGRQVKYAEENQKIEPEIKAARQRLTEGVSFSGKNRIVEPLLRTTWDQGNPYNGMCPPDQGGPGGHCYAGCVATAVGQLMFYHRWPQQGTGEYSYEHPEYGIQYANFGETNYNWNGMETSLSGPNSHVALLLYHLGISFDMDYGPNGSGMWNHSAANSMRNFFKYGPETQYIFRDTTTMNWDSILVTNLDAKKPLYYAGWEAVGSQNGHAFVCDGYAPDNFYHFNWGWSSSYDGYFLLSALMPGGNNFNFAQEVIKDIYPDTTQYEYPIYCQGIDTLQTITGTFSDGSNMVNYPGNSECTWLIQPDEPDYDSISGLQLSFPLLDLAENDFLRIYQGNSTSGNPLAEITGNQAPAIIEIPASTATVVFSAPEGGANGFLASYKSQLPVYCSGTTTFNEASGVIEDGSNDKNYTNNSLCKWRIIPQNLVTLTLTFETFDVEPEHDILQIYDLGTQQLVASLSGDDLPPPLTIAGGKAYLIFNTNDSGTAQGWKLNWAPAGSVGVELHENPPGNIYPNPVSDLLWLDLKLPTGIPAEAEIYSASGKLTLKKLINSNDYRSPVMIDTRTLEPGLYLLKIISAESVATYRFIKL